MIQSQNIWHLLSSNAHISTRWPHFFYFGARNIYRVNSDRIRGYRTCETTDTPKVFFTFTRPHNNLRIVRSISWLLLHYTNQNDNISHSFKVPYNFPKRDCKCNLRYPSCKKDNFWIITIPLKPLFICRIQRYMCVNVSKPLCICRI